MSLLTTHDGCTQEEKGSKGRRVEEDIFVKTRPDQQGECGDRFDVYAKIEGGEVGEAAHGCAHSPTYVMEYTNQIKLLCSKFVVVSISTMFVDLNPTNTSTQETQVLSLATHFPIIEPLEFMGGHTKPQQLPDDTPPFVFPV